MIVISTLSDKLVGRIAQLLEKDWFLECGGISFSFYIIHQLGIRIIDIVVHMIGEEIFWTLPLPIYFLIIHFMKFLVNIIVKILMKR